jgi:hypothetical protein
MFMKTSILSIVAAISSIAFVSPVFAGGHQGGNTSAVNSSIGRSSLGALGGASRINSSFGRGGGSGDSDKFVTDPVSFNRAAAIASQQNATVGGGFRSNDFRSESTSRGIDRGQDHFFLSPPGKVVNSAGNTAGNVLADKTFAGSILNTGLSNTSSAGSATVDQHPLPFLSSRISNVTPVTNTPKTVEQTVSVTSQPNRSNIQVGPGPQGPPTLTVTATNSGTQSAATVTLPAIKASSSSSSGVGLTISPFFSHNIFSLTD